MLQQYYSCRSLVLFLLLDEVILGSQRSQTECVSYFFSCMRIVGAFKILALFLIIILSHISVLRRLGFEILRHFRSVLNLSRSEVDQTSPLLLQSFHFSTPYTRIDLMDLKAHMKESSDQSSVSLDAEAFIALDFCWFKDLL